MFSDMQELSKRILTVGCAYKDPKGGIAQVLKSYDTYIFDRFRFVANSDGKGGKLRKLFTAVIALVKMVLLLIFDREIAIVHIHTASYRSFDRSAWFVRAAKLCGKKVVLHIHGGGFKNYYATRPRFVSRILDRCDCIIVLSESWRIFVQGVTECPNIRILENIIDDPVYLDSDRDGSEFRLLFLGLITQQKGIFDLLEMLSEHREEFEGKLRLHVGGNGEVDTLNRMIEELHLHEIVEYEGWVSGNKKIELFNLVDAYILPSYVEGLPISIMEAMSYGLPVLSTPVGGIPEVVSADNGILFAPGNKEDMYVAVHDIMADNGKCAAMGARAKQICQSYLPCAVRKKLIDIYAEMLMQRGV